MKRCLALVLFTALFIAAAALLSPHRSEVVLAQTAFTNCETSRSTVTAVGATSGTSATQIVGLVTGEPIYVCSLTLVNVSGTTPTFSLVYGTGTNCGTGQNTFLAPITTTAKTPVTFPRFMGAIPSGNALCYLAGGTTPVTDYILVYAQG